MAAFVTLNGAVHWQHLGAVGQREPTGLTISVASGHRSQLKAATDLAKDFANNKIDWLAAVSGGLWLFRSERFKVQFPEYAAEAWLNGDVLIPMDHEIRMKTVTRDGWKSEEPDPWCEFVITPEMVEEQMPKKIFLSHKGGADKPMVRRYKAALDAVGIVAWLDEDAMPAGTELERGLLAGFKESCAAVFFITPRYKDDGFLATEVNYAIAERRKKGDRFRIVSLLIRDADGTTGDVPELLQPYVWKTPISELDGFSEIIRAVPIVLGPATWRG